MVYPACKGPNEAGQWNQENDPQCSTVAEDSEAQWQDVSQKTKLPVMLQSVAVEVIGHTSYRNYT